MQHVKRVTLLAGHYGSGKTNIAVNLAMALRQQYDRVLIADLDIVNPYFRTKDSADALARAGIRLICSDYANTNLDAPALPQELYAVTDDRSYRAVMDIGGDDRGALALGRYAPALLDEDDYELLFVANFYRPLTPDAPSAAEVMREIEAACGMRFTGIVHNSNLAADTTPDTVRVKHPEALRLAAQTGLPLRMTTVVRPLVQPLTGELPDLFGLTLQAKYY